MTAVEREPADVLVIRAPGIEKIVAPRTDRLGSSLHGYGSFRPDPRLRFQLVGCRATPRQGGGPQKGAGAEIFDIAPAASWKGELLDFLLSGRFSNETGGGDFERPPSCSLGWGFAASSRAARRPRRGHVFTF